MDGKSSLNFRELKYSEIVCFEFDVSVHIPCNSYMASKNFF